MAVIENTLPVLLIILFLGIVIPELFKKFKLPFISSLIVLGAILGPHGLKYVELNDTIFFFGFLGSAFLMLMAGLEVKKEYFKGMEKKLYFMAALNGLIPFATGFAIVKIFGYSWMSATIIGIVFISSSVAVVTAALKSARLTNSKIGQVIIATVVIEDMMSLLLLSIVLQTVNPITKFPLPIYFGLLLFSIIALKMFLPQIAKYFFKANKSKVDVYEKELRFVIATLIAVLLFFSALGVHPIIAAFLVGILLADVVKAEELYNKLHTLAFGLFVPVFFFIVGMEMDLGVFAHFDLRNGVIMGLLIGLVGSKYLTGFASARWAKFSRKQSSFFGIASTAQLTTTLATVYAAASLNILDNLLITSIIMISVITTLLSPILLNIFNKK